MKSALLILLFALCACSVERKRLDPAPSPSDGAPKKSSVGNGGDLTSILVDEAKVHAAGVLARLDRESFPPSIVNYLGKQDLIWLLDHKGELASDILASPHSWQPKLPANCPEQDKCACAFPGDRAGTIHFANGQCADEAHTKETAGRLLIHESMHHLEGPDEARANRIAAAVYSTWQLIHPGNPHWLPVATGNALNDYDAVWTGEEMLVWSFGQMQSYRPSTNRWSDKRAGSYRDLLHNPVSDAVFERHSFWLDDKIVMFVPRYDEVLREGSGLVFNPKTGEWKPLTSVGAPLPRGERGRYLSDERHLVVWGGERTDGKDAGFAEGAVYDAVTARWEPIPASGLNPPELPWLVDNALLANGELYLIGMDIAHGGRTFGHVYDLKTRRWRELPAEGAPPFAGASRDGSHRVVTWVGDSLFVYQGAFDYRSDIAFTGEGLQAGEPKKFGARYFPRRNAWQPISVEGAPYGNPRLHKFLRGVTVGKQVVVFGNSQLSLYDPRHDEWQPVDTAITPHLEEDAGNTLSPRYGALDPIQTFWTGFELLVWNGHQGYRFYP